MGSGDATQHVAAFGDLTINADGVDQRIDNVTGVTASVSGGVTGASGGGLELNNDIRNVIAAKIVGAINVNAIGDLAVKANQKALIDADASNVTVAVSLGAALGVSLVENTIASTVNALVQDTTALANDISVIATTDDKIEKTTAVGVSASFVGATGNSSKATIENLVQAQAINADLTAVEDVTVQALANHYARASANGGAFGAIAAGAMTAEVNQGGLTSGGVAIPEVFAQIGDGSKIHAMGISLSAQSTDDLLATSIAAAGGLVAGSGADSKVTSDQSATARVGSNAELNANAIQVVAYANQNGDSSADSFTLGAATGAGAGATNRILGDTTIKIDTGAKLSANTLTLGSSNIAMKDGPVGSNNIRSGSVAAANASLVLSDTRLGSSSNPLGSYINVMPGATLEVGGTNSNPGVLNIEATTKADGVDSVRLETASGYSATHGHSEIRSNTDANVNLNGSTIINRSGDVKIATQSDVNLRPSSNLFSASVNAYAGADAIADADVDNTITVSGATIRGGEVRIQSGRNNFQVPNLLATSSNIEVTTVSLGPSIAIGVPVSSIDYVNQIDVLGIQRSRRSKMPR